MLSRFSLRGLSLDLRTKVLKFQPVSALATSAGSPDSEVKKSNPPSDASKYPPEFPLPTSKRDFVNYPRPVMPEYSPPVRFGFIPDSWFQFFYPKTGYTGPYLLMATFGTYLFSKEVIVIEEHFTHAVAFIVFCAFIHHKFGDQIGNAYNKMYEEKILALDGEQEQEKQLIRNDIQYYKDQQKKKEAVMEITKATTEVVHLQMELAFRERLEAAYQAVKSKLDCQAELENVERRFVQKNLMDFVLSNVMKSITPELQKITMQSCVKDLNALASKS